jgi:hypothetical protein
MGGYFIRLPIINVTVKVKRTQVIPGNVIVTGEQLKRVTGPVIICFSGIA